MKDKIPLISNDLWKILSNYGISKIGNVKIHKGGYFNISSGSSVNEDRLFGRFKDFEFNINRVMIIYEELLKCEQYKDNNLNLKFQLLSEIIIILLMTSLEAYLRDTFIAVISNIKELAENKNIKEKIEKLYLDIKENRPIFQKSYVVKSAYLLLGINLIEIKNHQSWKRIFSKGKLNSKSIFSGYMKMRHNFIHKGAYESLFKHTILNDRFIKIAIIDVVKLVYHIQIRIPDYTVGFMLDSIELFKYGKIKFIDK